MLLLDVASANLYKTVVDIRGIAEKCRQGDEMPEFWKEEREERKCLLRKRREEEEEEEGGERLIRQARHLTARERDRDFLRGIF